MAVTGNRSAQQFVFDTSSIIGIDRSRFASIEGERCVPLPVVHELLHATSSGDQRKERRSRAALSLVSREGGVRILPGFGDTVRLAFGERRQFWPQEEEEWYRIAAEAGRGVAWGDLQSSWNAMYRAGETEISADTFGQLKDARGDFEADYRAATEALAEGAPARPILIGQDHPDISNPIRDGSGRERTVSELSILAQLAGGAGIDPFPEMLDSANLLSEEDRGFPLFCACRLAAERYRGGLDFVVRMTSQCELAYIQRRGAPDGNDFFDYWIQACVPDFDGAVFVTEEQRWHRVAELLRIGHRVKHESEILMGR